MIARRNDKYLMAYCFYPPEDAQDDLAQSQVAVYVVTTISMDRASEGYWVKKHYHIPLAWRVDGYSSTHQQGSTASTKISGRLAFDRDELDRYWPTGIRNGAEGDQGVG